MRLVYYFFGTQVYTHTVVLFYCNIHKTDKIMLLLTVSTLYTLHNLVLN